MDGAGDGPGEGRKGWVDALVVPPEVTETVCGWELVKVAAEAVRVWLPGVSPLRV